MYHPPCITGCLFLKSPQRKQSWLPPRSAGLCHTACHSAILESASRRRRPCFCCIAVQVVGLPSFDPLCAAPSTQLACSRRRAQRWMNYNGRRPLTQAKCALCAFLLSGLRCVGKCCCPFYGGRHEDIVTGKHWHDLAASQLWLAPPQMRDSLGCMRRFINDCFIVPSVGVFICTNTAHTFHHSPPAQGMQGKESLTHNPHRLYRMVCAALPRLSLRKFHFF